MKVFIQNIGNVNLDQKNYIGAGGEAEVYKHGQHAIKVFHDPKKAIPEQKIKELGILSEPNILKPINIVYNDKNKVIGYMMQFINDTEPICKLFTKTFKANNNISNNDIVDIVKKMQKTVNHIHINDTLIVDLNEMNILMSKDLKTPYFIDVDSYQTKSYRATAIMESIRDRMIKNNQWTPLSDWYSFAILAFQLYVGIHPYKGTHPKYKPSEWTKRMDDGISVFDKHASVPAVCNSFNIIPKKHLDWMKELFVNNKRDVPPDIDVSTPIVVPDQIIIIKSSGKFDTQEVYNCSENIKQVYDIMGIKYYITATSIYKDNAKIYDDVKSCDKLLICGTNNRVPIICRYTNGNVVFQDLKGKNIAEVKSRNIMVLGNSAYTIINDGLFENTFVEMNNRIFHSIKRVGNVSEYTTKVYPGVIYEDLLGKHWITLPEEGRVLSGAIPELNGFRVIDMSRSGHICVILCESKGIYYRFILCFDMTKPFTYTCRKVDDVTYDDINFTVLDNGVCILVVDNGSIEVFKDNNHIKTVDNAPIDSSMKLESFINSVFAINNKKMYKISMK